MPGYVLMVERSDLTLSTLARPLLFSGWHLGERNMWEKKGLDELDTRVPLLIRVPGLTSGKRTVRQLHDHW